MDSGRSRCARRRRAPDGRGEIRRFRRDHTNGAAIPGRDSESESLVRVVTFGEIMLRLGAPGFERLLQSPTLAATFGGAEANVAVALSHWGEDAGFVTVLP